MWSLFGLNYFDVKRLTTGQLRGLHQRIEQHLEQTGDGDG